MNTTKPLSAREEAERSYRDAPNRVGSYLTELDIVGKVVVDFGCGWGGESQWLSEQGASLVIGIDANVKALEEAAKFSPSDATQFATDLTDVDAGSVDIVTSTNVFEHVMDLTGVMDEIKRVLKPGGVLVSRFGPLFYSPYGCHFYWAAPFPYSHLILGRLWLKRRIDKIRGYQSDTESWEDMGLNRVTYATVARIVRSRFAVERLIPVPVKGQHWAVQLPLVGNLFIFGVDLKVVKAS